MVVGRINEVFRLEKMLALIRINGVVVRRGSTVTVFKKNIQ